VTFYKSVKDLPDFTDYAMSNRTYRYFTGPVLYPFGYGLSYTTFSYSNLQAPSTVATSEEMRVTVQVKNTGPMAGDEVAQIYVNNPPSNGANAGSGGDSPSATAAGALPPKTLVGFQRVTLQPNEQKTLEFTVTPHQLGAAFRNGRRVNVPRSITLQVGGSSAGGLTQQVNLTGNAAEPEYRFVAPKILQATGQ
jgi:beta-glucosidase